MNNNIYIFELGYNTGLYYNGKYHLYDPEEIEQIAFAINELASLNLIQPWEEIKHVTLDKLLTDYYNHDTKATEVVNTDTSADTPFNAELEEALLRRIIPDKDSCIYNYQIRCAGHCETCIFNQLDIPCYTETEEEMHKNIHKVATSDEAVGYTFTH